MGTALMCAMKARLDYLSNPGATVRLDDCERPVAAGGVDNEAAKTDSAYRKGCLELHGWIGAGRLSRVGGAGTDGTSETLRQHSETGV